MQELQQEQNQIQLINGLAVDVIVVSPYLKSLLHNPAGTAEVFTDDDKNSSTMINPDNHFNVSCSDFIVQFPLSSSSMRSSLRPFYGGNKKESDNTDKLVKVKINDHFIPELIMMCNSEKAEFCRFINGNVRPQSCILERLISENIITAGKNSIAYYNYRGKTCHIAEALLYLWSSGDSIVISDIDGTVTKSNLYGVVDTCIRETYEYSHEGVCEFFTQISNYASPESMNRIRFLYLTSRPISYIVSTRKFIHSLSQMNNDTKENSAPRHTLPNGPIFCNTASLSQVLYSELFAKNAHVFKSNALWKQVIQPFEAAGRKNDLFLSAFGNNSSDRKAYEKAGLSSEKIYIINKKSEIKCCAGERYSASARSSFYSQDSALLERSYSRSKSLKFSKSMITGRKTRLVDIYYSYHDSRLYFDVIENIRGSILSDEGTEVSLKEVGEKRSILRADTI